MQKDAFQFIQNEQSKLKSNRHLKAGQDYQKAIHALTTCIENGFEDKKLLIKATQSFTTAIRHNRKDPKPYIGMAYLWLLVGDQKQALKYIKGVLEFAPNHPTAKLILQGLQETHKQTTKSKSQAAEANYPQLLTNLNQQLEKTQKQIRPIETLDPQKLTQIKAQVHTLKTFKQGLEAQLKTLGQKLSLKEIQTLQKPLDTILERYQKSARNSEVFQQINQEIQQTIQETNRCFQQLNTSPAQIDTPEFQKTADKIYDTCDKLADQLDALDESGVDIGLIEGEYEKLMTYVQCLQERMDDDF